MQNYLNNIDIISIMKKRICFIILLLFVLVGCTESPGVQDQPSEDIADVVQFPEQEGVIDSPEANESDPIVKEEILDEAKVQHEQDTSQKLSTGCSRTFSPTLSTGHHYDGPLFDAHFHMPSLIDFSKIEGLGVDRDTNSITDPVLGKDVSLDKILCNFDKEKVKGAIGFVVGAEQLLEETLEIAESMKEESSGKINLFLMPVMFSTEGLESIEKSNKGLFKGYGEMAFYDQYYANAPPDSPVVMETYKVAEKHNLIVMIHPGRNQKSNIGNVLQKNPNVNFLLHGFEIENDIVDLMDKYPNVYFSIDSAVLYAMQGLFMGSKEQFVSRFEQEFDVNMNRAVNKWKSAVEKHPDRFMWGSDRGLPWHYDEDVSILFEEFGRAFIGKLDPSVQEKFAYENAEELIATVS